MKPRHRSIVVSAVFIAAGSAAGAGPIGGQIPAVVGYNRDVRPILSNTCFKCHGQDAAANKSGLRLDRAAEVTAPRKDAQGRMTTAIVPGKPEASEIWRRINASDGGVVMPPPDALHRLSDRYKAVLRRWIEQGAKYESHWSYLAPRKTTPPTADRTPAGFVRNEIDRFVLAKLNESALLPSPEADRRTLIRRLSLDLLGLPPIPEDTEAFVADSRPDAYERLVDRLLASPHYGERMAVPWLDIVRFADSVGYNGDQWQNVFPYRDYVIASFNRNKPFDVFTREQIAGDLLPEATTEQRIASGFNRLNLVTREAGSQPREFLAKYAADRVRAVSTTWLGSTLGCAECHDHKYDPFSARDFYALSAYFADIKQWGVYISTKMTPEPELENFTYDHPFPPEIDVENDYLQRRGERLQRRFLERVTTATHSPRFEGEETALRSWAGEVASRLRADPSGWSVTSLSTGTANTAARVVPQPDASVRFEADATMGRAPAEGRQDVEKFTLELTSPPGPLATIRLEVLPDPLHGGRIARGGNDSVFVKLSFAVRRTGESELQPLDVADVFVDHDTETYFKGYLLTSLREGWRSDRRLSREPHAAIYLLKQSLALAAGDRVVATLGSRNVGRVRFSVSPFGGRLPFAAIPAEIAAAFGAREPTSADRRIIAAQYFLGTGRPDATAFASALGDLREIAACRSGRAYTVATVSTEPLVTRVLPRGNWQDQSGEIVAPEPPRFLSADSPAADGARRTRLDLARWLTSRENPLTARAFVNRLWQQLFGTGLSAIPDDLGAQGEFPSHPELLDWLAVEFMDRGWDVKAMVRLIVTSGTYRQDSRYRPELADVDPHNRLLARQSDRRLDAEFIRDNALFAAGLLDPEIGGPSIRPYQPEGYYAALSGVIRDYSSETDDRQYRRGVYIHRQRTTPHPMLWNFDAPAREECTAVRNLSSTPQQALTLLNDPTFVEAARVLAQHVLADSKDGSFASRLAEAFRRLLARDPVDEERRSLAIFLEQQSDYYRRHPDDAGKLVSIGLRSVPDRLDRVELAAWTALVRVLLNLNETIVRH